MKLSSHSQQQTEMSGFTRCSAELQWCHSTRMLSGCCCLWMIHPGQIQIICSLQSPGSILTPLKFP